MHILSATSKRHLMAAVSAAFVPLAVQSAYAAMLTIPSPAYTDVSSSESIPDTSSPTLGDDGFEIFDFGQGGTASANTLSPVPYATIGINASDTYTGSNTSYSTLTVNGTAKLTGVIVHNNANLITISMTSNTSVTIPYEFQLGLMRDNTAGVGGNSTDYIVADGGTTITTSKLSIAQTNDFYFVDITGAQYGDVITIAGTLATNSDCIGGVTFDTLQLSAPEPTSICLSGVGALALLLRRRRAHARRE